MKLTKIRMAAMAALAFLTSLCACSTKSNQANGEDSTAVAATEFDGTKAIVCYFSATGTTQEAAERLAKLTGAAIHEIVPEAPYTEADLNWRDSLSRSSVEMKELSSRPAVKDAKTDMSAYEVIFIGYPNWWDSHPTIINTFIEANELQGKTIVPFMTSGGSTIDNSAKLLKETYPNLTFAKGLLMNDVTDEEIISWTNSLAKK